MVKEAAKKCSLCGNNGHNSRTCNEKVVKLFGVRILKEREDEAMPKSLSMENLNACVDDHKSSGERGYVSDGLVQSGRDPRGRKKGIPWSEEEHKTFLDGLEKLGKGDWRGISRKFVMTRTPTQVASHAQKYFLRQAIPTIKKRRSSLFDVPINPSALAFPPVPLSTINRILPQQKNVSKNFGTQIAAQGAVVPPIIPRPATSSIPNFHGIPYMSGNAGRRLSYQGHRLFYPISFVPMLTLHNQGNVHVPCGPNNLSSSLSIPSQPSSVVPLLQSAPHRASLTKTAGNPPLVKTNLELSIAAPQEEDLVKLSPQTSSSGGAIRVI